MSITIALSWRPTLFRQAPKNRGVPEGCSGGGGGDGGGGGGSGGRAGGDGGVNNAMKLQQ